MEKASTNRNLSEKEKKKAQNLKITILPPPFLFEHSVCFFSFLPLIHAYNYTPYLPFLSLSPLSAGDHNAAPPLDLKCPFAATIITSRQWGAFTGHCSIARIAFFHIYIFEEQDVYYRKDIQHQNSV